MPCLIALVILSILGLFSASHRQLAREAFDCVFRRLTRQPCQTGFDVKIKAKMLGPVLARSPKIAGWVYRRFEWLAWGLVMGMTVTSIWTIRGVYNYWAWGSCQGQFNQGEFCVFDPTNSNNQATGAKGAECTDSALASQALSVEGIDQTIFPRYQNGQIGKPVVLLVGCVACPFTRQAYPSLKEVLAESQAEVRFAHYPTRSETKYLLPYDVCVQTLKPERFGEYLDRLLTNTPEQVTDKQYVDNLLKELGLDQAALNQCLSAETTTRLVQAQQAALLNMGIYGTPTVFIGETALVGPKPERVYRRLLD
ncbi:hypothetical protein A2W24_02970 [Microgenomates group bacterium RBG_16_45_19]|nr:MAG: hypothetical protein A2W24_02970 [Microgenomates group bacterium RBG_16_45_19]